MLTHSRWVTAWVARVVVQYRLLFDRNRAHVSQRSAGIVGALQVREVGEGGVAVVHDRPLDTADERAHLRVAQVPGGQIGRPPGGGDERAHRRGEAGRRQVRICLTE